MKTKKFFINIFLLLMLFLFGGCTLKEQSPNNEPISVYLWSYTLYNNGYVSYIQSQLPNINIEFVVGNNDLSYYQFMKDNGQLPDIITTRRFSLHDALGLKDQLLDLSTTEVAGEIYDSYIKDFTYPDGSINWLPVCGEADGIVINRTLFVEKDIPIPTDYNSFVYACQKFEEEGIRGFVGDFKYDYTCLSVLQGLSITGLKSFEGKVWRNNYANDLSGNYGLDDVIWPETFDKMSQFISDANIKPEDLTLSYSTISRQFKEGKIAMIRAAATDVSVHSEIENIDPQFLPYFGPNGEEWLLTYPAFQVAVNKDVKKNSTRKNNALKVLEVMFSEEAQRILSAGNDVVSYSQNVNIELSSGLANLKKLIDQNRLYIRIASNEFFSVSQDIVSKMIKGEYNAQEAYENFDNLLKQPSQTNNEIVWTLEKGYNNHFTENGNEAYSVMANTLRKEYGSDILIAPAVSFTGTLFAGEYSDKMVGYMIMPNALDSYKGHMTGARLKQLLKDYVERKKAGYKPFNLGSLPTVSGITIEVREENGTYILENVYKDGVILNDEEEFTVTLLSNAGFVGSLLIDDTLNFVKESERVINKWKKYILAGGTLENPEKYIIIK